MPFLIRLQCDHSFGPIIPKLDLYQVMIPIFPYVFIGLVKLLSNVELLKSVFQLGLHVSYPHDIAEVLGFVAVYAVGHVFAQDVAVLFPMLCITNFFRRFFFEWSLHVWDGGKISLVIYAFTVSSKSLLEKESLNIYPIS